MTTRFLDNLRPFCVFVAALAIAGCSSESDKKPPPHAGTNRNVLTPSGTPVGHLKPRRMSKARHDPVVWVVVGNAVERRSDEVLIHAFRLDFDETQTITEADLPYALMTNNSKEIVVHRGKPPKDFSHPDINDGEPCSPIYQCGNLDECPRVKELMNLALFPYGGSEEKPKCPYCGGNKRTGRYTIPQHSNMKRYIGRTP